MSERRERVAKAMYLSEYLPLDENAAATWDRYSPEYSNIKQRWLSLADAAIAAMDAEPTEAEVEAAAIHLYSTFAHDYEESEDVEGAWSEMTELRKRPWRYDGKCTLIAARKACP